MSVIDPVDINPELDEDDIYQAINSLAITYYEFAKQVGLYWRLFGVFTNAEEGGEKFNFTVNSCLRDAIFRTLLEVQDQTEHYLRYNLTERYHDEVYDLPSDGKIMLRWGGVDQLNVEPLWTEIQTGVNIDYIAQSNVTVTSEGSRYYVQVDSAIFPNPEDVVIRGTNLGKYPIDRTVRPTKLGANWKLYLDTSNTAYNGVDQLDAYHIKYAFLSHTFAASTDIAESHPVYAGTKQYIPVVETTIAGLDVTYKIPIYAMTRPEFLQREVNIEDGDYYKLMDTFDVQKYSYSAVTMLITRSCEDRVNDTYVENTYATDARILDRDSGLIEINLDPLDGCTSSITPCYDPVFTVRIQYVTKPSRLTEEKRNAIVRGIRAIRHKVAAELPTDDCGCHISVGFIFEQQKSYQDVRRDVFGNETISLDYGNLHGQRVYQDLMAKMPVGSSGVFVIPLHV